MPVERKQPVCLAQVVGVSCAQGVRVPVQAEVLLQVQFELPTQAVAEVKVEHDVGVPLQLVAELHWHIALVWQALLDVNVLQAVGVPVQVPLPDDHMQLYMLVPQPVLSVNAVQGVGVPLQSRLVASQTHPGKRAHVD